MLLEYGNIVLESSVDRNITFRARGQGSVNMITEQGHYSLSHQMVGVNSGLMARIDALESTISSGRLLDNRLSALEERLQAIEVRIFFQSFSDI